MRIFLSGILLSLFLTTAVAFSVHAQQDISPTPEPNSTLTVVDASGLALPQATTLPTLDGSSDL